MHSQNCEKHLLASSCVSARPSIHPSVCMEQLSSNNVDFHEIWYFECSSKFYWQNIIKISKQ